MFSCFFCFFFNPCAEFFGTIASHLQFEFEVKKVWVSSISFSFVYTIFGLVGA